MAEKVVFDGPNKLIYVTSGSVTLDVKSEVYSAWKRWIRSGSNAQYLEALRTVGGDPIDETTILGDTYFLTNGWRIRGYDGTYTLNVAGNLYTEEGSGSYLSITGSGTVTYLSTVSNLIQTSIIQQDEIEYSSYNGGVTLDVINGSAGTTFPIGTSRSPVNNLQDAQSIATTRGFKKIFLRNDTIFESDDNLDGYIFITDVPEIYLQIESSSTHYTQFKDINISGSFNGHVHFENCKVGDVNNVYGDFKYCIIQGNINVVTESSEQVLFYDCYTGQVTAPPILDMGGDGPKVAIRGYTGAMRFTNKTGSTQASFIDLNSARVGFDSGITSGSFIIRGVGYIYLNDSTNTTFDVTGLMSTQTVTEVTSASLSYIQTDIIYISESIGSVEASLPAESSASIANIEIQTTYISESVGPLQTDVTYISESIGSIEASLPSDISSSIANTEAAVIDVSASMAAHRDATEERIRYIIGLSQHNFRMTNQTYDSENHMLTATVNIYDNASDATNDVNVTKQWAVSASYDGDGNMTSYLSKEI